MAMVYHWPRGELALLQAPALALDVLDVVHLAQGGPDHAGEVLALGLVARRQDLLGQLARRHRLAALLEQVGQEYTERRLTARPGWRRTLPRGRRWGAGR